MDNELALENKEREKILDIHESNFKECLGTIHKYLTLTLVLTVIYFVVVLTPQQIEIPGLPIKVEGNFALALLAASYIAFGAMATYVAERAWTIARELVHDRPDRLKALSLSPSLGTTDIPVVRFVVCFLPTAIFSFHSIYLGYENSNWGYALLITFYLSVGVTLWLLLPIGEFTPKKRKNN